MGHVNNPLQTPQRLPLHPRPWPGPARNRFGLQESQHVVRGFVQPRYATGRGAELK